MNKFETKKKEKNEMGSVCVFQKQKKIVQFCSFQILSEMELFLHDFLDKL